MSTTYIDWNKRVKRCCPAFPWSASTPSGWLQQFKDAIKASLHHGMLFEELGFMYLGPIDGHDLRPAQLSREGQGDGRAHPAPCPDQQGARLRAGRERPGQVSRTGPVSQGRARHHSAQVLVEPHLHRRRERRPFEACRRDPKVAIITAAMCEGNKLQKIRDTFPDQFFDVGICESHAVAFAAGMAKTGARPVVDIYSTFLQRSTTRSSRKCPSGPARRLLPGPCGAGRCRRPHAPWQLRPGLSASLPQHGGDGARRPARRQPHVRVRTRALKRRVAIRYPRANLESVDRDLQPIELGQAEILEWETDGMIISPAERWWATVSAQPASCGNGTACAWAWSTPGSSSRLTGSPSARPSRSAGFVLTVEEGCLMGGFGSAVLEAANDAGISTGHVRRLGLPDQFVLHAEREEQLAEVGLDVEGIIRSAVELARAVGLPLPDLKSMAAPIHANGLAQSRARPPCRSSPDYP